jgi:hypothetical protein
LVKGGELVILPSMGVNSSGWLWTLVDLECPPYGEEEGARGGMLVNISVGLWNIIVSSFDQALTKEPVSEYAGDWLPSKPLPMNASW